MKLCLVFGIFCFTISLQHHDTAAQRERNDGNRSYGNDDFPLRDDSDPPSPSVEDFSVGLTVKNASLCQWSCLKCIDNGTQHRCTSCKEGFQLSDENDCQQTTTPYTFSSNEVVEADPKRALGAAVFMVAVGLGVAFCGLMTLFFVCHLSGYGNDARSTLFRGTGDLHGSVRSASREVVFASSSQEMVPESVFVIVHNPDGVLVVGVEKG